VIRKAISIDIKLTGFSSLYVNIEPSPLDTGPESGVD